MHNDLNFLLLALTAFCSTPTFTAKAHLQLHLLPNPLPSIKMSSNDDNYYISSEDSAPEDMEMEDPTSDAEEPSDLVPKQPSNPAPEQSSDPTPDQLNNAYASYISCMPLRTPLRTLPMKPGVAVAGPGEFLSGLFLILILLKVVINILVLVFKSQLHWLTQNGLLSANIP